MNEFIVTSKNWEFYLLLTFKTSPDRFDEQNSLIPSYCNICFVTNSFPGTGWGSQCFNGHVSDLLEDGKGTDFFVR